MWGVEKACLRPACFNNNYHVSCNARETMKSGFEKNEGERILRGERMKWGIEKNEGESIMWGVENECHATRGRG